MKIDYIFGNVYRNGAMFETVKTVGDEHTDLSGYVSITRKYADSHITDNFVVVEKYQSITDDSTRICYDWYIIENHYRYEDKFTPQIGGTEQEITELEICGIEQEQVITELEIQSMEQEQAITDNEIAIMELIGKIGG